MWLRELGPDRVPAVSLLALLGFWLLLSDCFACFQTHAPKWLSKLGCHVCAAACLTKDVLKGAVLSGLRVLS